MGKPKVTPLRASHDRKEARLRQMRSRFEQAHPQGRSHSRPRGGRKLLVIALAVAALMIWLASSIAG